MTNDKDSAVLEPCPFCGGEAAIGTGRNYYFVLCPDCLTSTNVVLAESIMPTEAEAIAAWNTRQPTQSDALREALEAVIALLDAPAEPQKGVVSAQDYARSANARIGLGLVMIAPRLRAALLEQSK